VPGLIYYSLIGFDKRLVEGSAFFYAYLTGQLPR